MDGLRNFTRIGFLFLVLTLSGACSHQLKRSEIENEQMMKMVTIRIVDAETSEPIPDGLCFLTQKKIGAASSGSCSDYIHIGPDGNFTYKPKRFNDKVSFWILAPGYKSVSLLYDKDVRTVAEILGGGSAESGAGAVALLLLSMIPTGSDLQTDLKSSVTMLPLHSFREKGPELWQAELSLGLWTLRQAVTGMAKDTLAQFIEKERQSIEILLAKKEMQDN